MIQNRFLAALLALGITCSLAALGGTEDDGTHSNPTGHDSFDREFITYSEFLSRQDRISVPISTPFAGIAGEQIELAYTDLGPRTGLPVVLVHGVPTSSWMFRYAIRELEQSGLRLIAVDNAGYGASEKPPMEVADAARFYGPAAQAKRLAILLEALDVEEAIFVVHDVGGAIVWELLADQPSLASGLVVLNTIGAPEGFSPPAAMDNRIVQAAMRAVAFRSDEAIRSLICPMVAVPERIDTPTQLEGYYAPFREGTSLPYYSFLANLDLIRERLDDYHQLLQSLDLPAALFWGEQDVDLLADPSANWFQQTLAIPPERSIVSPDARHLVAEEEPAAIADLIRMVAEDVASR